MTSRKTDCDWRTGSRKAGSGAGSAGIASVLAAHKREEVDPGRGRLRTHARVRGGSPRLDRSDEARSPVPSRHAGPAPAHRRGPRAGRAGASARAGRRSRPRRFRAARAARVTVASPTLKGGPLPPMRPRSMTSPVSTGRSSSAAGSSPSAASASFELGLGRLRTRRASRPAAPRRRRWRRRWSPSQWSSRGS